MTSVPEIIRKKRDGACLNEGEIRTMIDGITEGTVGEEQIGAFLMAVYFQGMQPDETVILTRAMLESGDTLQWPNAPFPIVDKHSTGGVGDKISLPLAPALAACGVGVPMVSGRGLGHTGGTLDKLESISGYQTRLTADEIKQIVQEVGCVICGQTDRIAPADKRIYSIRDITSTVESVPLITGSILSKKASAGLGSLVLDVKVGEGAFMNDLAQAQTLAESLVRVSKGLGIKTAALITEMDHPIGRTIGNGLEVIESVECLHGNGPADTTELVCALGGELLHLSGVSNSPEEGFNTIWTSLNDGSALERFRAMVAAVGGDTSVCDDPVEALPKAPVQTDIPVRTEGFVLRIGSRMLADIALELGAGRTRKEDDVDPAVGIEILVSRGQELDPGQAWLRIHHRNNLTESQIERLQSALFTAHDAPDSTNRIIEIVR
jgi:thymidine phosphorylase